MRGLVCNVWLAVCLQIDVVAGAEGKKEWRDGGDKERPESFYSQLVPLEAVQTAQMNQGHVAWMVTSQCGPVKPPGRACKTCCRWSMNLVHTVLLCRWLNRPVSFQRNHPWTMVVLRWRRASTGEVRIHVARRDFIQWFLQHYPKKGFVS